MYCSVAVSLWMLQRIEGVRGGIGWVGVIVSRVDGTCECNGDVLV